MKLVNHVVLISLSAKFAPKYNASVAKPSLFSTKLMALVCPAHRLSTTVSLALLLKFAINVPHHSTLKLLILL